MTDELHVYGYGKLLITGEYFILKGARGLAVPVRFRQHLYVRPQAGDHILWRSFHPDQTLWTEARYDRRLKLLHGQPLSDARLIGNILRILQQLQPHLFRRGYRLETRLEFRRDWGLGTSSSLIAVLAKWAQVNPFELLDRTFNGSGFDVAVSLGGKPLIFWREGAKRHWTFTSWKPRFRKHLYFVHLNRKQPTLRVVQKFNALQLPATRLEQINRLTDEIAGARSLGRFSELILEHEALVGKSIGRKPVGQRLFADYDGAIKSLGAWGGDMILAAGGPHTPDYFRAKGYETIFPFEKLIKTG